MRKLAILVGLLLGAVSVQAQQNCNDEKAHHEIVNVNSALETQGFKLEFTGNAMISNKAGFAYKIKAEKGATYQINMMLPAIANKLNVTILDAQRNVILEDKVSKDKLNNLLTKTLVADKTGTYILIISGKGNICFPLSILKKNI